MARKEAAMRRLIALATLLVHLVLGLREAEITMMSSKQSAGTTTLQNEDWLRLYCMAINFAPVPDVCGPLVENIKVEGNIHLDDRPGFYWFQGEPVFSNRVHTSLGHKALTDRTDTYFIVFQDVLNSGAVAMDFYTTNAFATSPNSDRAVHQGAWNLWNPVKKGFQEAIASIKGAHEKVNFVFLGYGLGGCMAAIAAKLLEQQAPGNHVVSLLTFGSPRYGNDAFYKLLRPAAFLNLVNFATYGGTAHQRLDPIVFQAGSQVPNSEAVRRNGETVERKELASLNAGALIAPFHDYSKTNAELNVVIDGFECLHSKEAYLATFTGHGELHPKCHIVKPALEDLHHGGQPQHHLNFETLNQAFKEDDHETSDFKKHDLNRLFFMSYYQVTNPTAKYGLTDAKGTKIHTFAEPIAVWASHKKDHVSLELQEPAALTDEEAQIAPNYIMLRDVGSPFSHRVFELFGHIVARAKGRHQDYPAHTVYFAFKGMRVTGNSASGLKQEYGRLVQRSELAQHPDFPGSIHQGAGEIFDAIKGTMSENLRNQVLQPALNNEKVHVVFVGYSFGGATAQLSAVHLLQILGDHADAQKNVYISVLTFGSPRVGDPEFGEFLRRGVSITHVITKAPYKDQGEKYEPVPFWPARSSPNAGLKVSVTKTGEARIPSLTQLPAAVELQTMGNGDNICESSFDYQAVFLAKVGEDVALKVAKGTVGLVSKDLANALLPSKGKLINDGFDCLHRSECYKGLLEFKLTVLEALAKANVACLPTK